MESSTEAVAIELSTEEFWEESKDLCRSMICLYV